MKLQWGHSFCLVREPSAMPPWAAAMWPLDTVLACRSPGLAWDSLGQFPWRYRTDLRCTQQFKSLLKGTLISCINGFWHLRYSPDISIYISPVLTSVQHWHHLTGTRQRRVLKPFLEGYKGQYRCQMQAARTPGLCSAYGRSWGALGT